MAILYSSFIVLHLIIFARFIFCLALGQVFVDALEAAGGDGHAARTHELEHAVVGLQLLVEVGDVVAHAVHLHDGEDGVASPRWRRRG